MTSILSRLLTADKPWSGPYGVPLAPAYHTGAPAPPPTPVSPPPPQYNVVSGNEFPPVQVPAGRRKKTTRKSQDAPVRFGRVPKREKAKILAAMQKVNASSQEKALCAELEDELRLLTSIVRAHEETCDYTKDKVAGLVEKARSHPGYNQLQTLMACPLNPAPHIMESGGVVEDFSERFAPAIQGVVEFAKRIPGFQFLSQDDQVTLLKAGVFEVLLVRLACMFDSQANSLICLNGQVLRRESLHASSNARFLLDSMFDFAERLNTLHLSDSEVGLFCAVVVIAADRPGLRNTELVLKIQKKMMDILQKSVSANHPENPNIFGDLIKKIPDLRTLNTLHSERLVEYKMEPRNRPNGILDAGTCAMYPGIPNDIWSQYTLVAAAAAVHQPPCLEDLRSASPGQHSQHGGSTTGSEWSTTDSKDEHDPVGSPRSLCAEDVKSPARSSSFSSSRGGYVNEEGWTPPQAVLVDYHHHHHGKHQGSSEHGSSSGDEGYFLDSPVKGGAGGYPKLKRVDSPTDSGIESGKEHGPSTTPTISVCSSPRSAVDEKVKEVGEEIPKRESPSQHIEDMPVLKRALQAPPLVNTNMLMDEAYRHHKKFRAARRGDVESPTSPVSLASTHSTLVRTLEQAPRYLSEQQLKRTDLIHNIIMRNEALPGQPSQPQQPSPQYHPQEQIFASVPNPSPPVPPPNYAAAGNGAAQQKNLLVCSNGYYIQHSSWPFGQQQQVQQQQQQQQQQVPVAAPVQFEHNPPSSTSYCSSSSPRYNARSPVAVATSNSPLVMTEVKPPGESQPLNLSKKLFAPHLLQMES